MATLFRLHGIQYNCIVVLVAVCIQSLVLVATGKCEINFTFCVNIETVDSVRYFGLPSIHIMQTRSTASPSVSISFLSCAYSFFLIF